MPKRLPAKLWTYILADLWRLLVLTTAVIVTVLALAITIRPLADGKLTPLQAIQFMGLAIPPMLAYAVPFGAGFAATLVYHRFAQDNELAAAHAGGVGHRSVLAPALISGVLLAGVLGGISDQVIPRFLRTMESYVRLSIADWMVVQLSLGNTFEFNGTVIGAEVVESLDPNRVEGAKTVIALGKPAFLFLNDQRQAASAATAQRAFLAIRPSETPWDGPDAGGGSGADGQARFGSVVTIVAENYRGTDEDGVVITSEDTFRYDFAVPPAIVDDPKFFTYTQLRTLRNHPERFDFIDEFRHRLALRAASVEALDDVDADLKDDTRAALTTAEGDVITIAGRHLSAGPALARRVIPATPGAPIDITIQRADGTTERVSAAKAVLDATAPDELTRKRVEIRLELEHVTTTGRSAAEDIRRAAESAEPVAGVRRARAVTGIITDSPRYLELRTATLDDLLADTRYLTEGPAAFHGAQEAHNRLKSMRADVLREIAANIHERIAMSLAGLVMVLTGAVVAIRLRHALALTVYLWAFFPALFSVLIISMGKQLTHEFGAIGVPTLYLGVVLPFGYALLTYKQICRR